MAHSGWGSGESLVWSEHVPESLPWGRRAGRAQCVETPRNVPRTNQHTTVDTRHNPTQPLSHSLSISHSLFVSVSVLLCFLSLSLSCSHLLSLSLTLSLSPTVAHSRQRSDENTVTLEYTRARAASAVKRFGGRAVGFSPRASLTLRRTAQPTCTLSSSQTP